MFYFRYIEAEHKIVKEFIKLKDSTGEASDNLKAKADAHTLFLFMNGFDFVNPPSYKDDHRVDPTVSTKKRLLLPCCRTGLADRV